MSKLIEFKPPTEFLGRNGQAKMAAILVDRLDGDLTLAPITSRRRIGRAYMLIPMAMVPAVAKAMLEVSGAAHRHAHVKRQAFRPERKIA